WCAWRLPCPTNRSTWCRPAWRFLGRGMTLMQTS
ncbi:MAG: hypothetical protein AVDCRST_MAG19-1624, partial [uncultured Thermomicrobiales bacterium]